MRYFILPESLKHYYNQNKCIATSKIIYKYFINSYLLYFEMTSSNKSSHNTVGFQGYIKNWNPSVFHDTAKRIKQKTNDFLFKLCFHNF